MWNLQSHRKVLLGLLVPGLLILSSIAAPARAAVVLHVTGFTGTLEEPTSQRVESEILLDTNRARLDDHGRSYILRLDRDELIIVEHTEKTYSRLPIPARFEDYVDPAAQELFDRKGLDLGGEQTAEIERAGEVCRFGEWRAERVEIEIRDEDGEKVEQLTLWLSNDLGVDTTVFKELLRHRAYASENGRRHWIDQFVDLEGFPVVQETTRFTPRGDFTHTVRLETVSERDVDESVYEPPKGYVEARFWSVRFAAPQPLP